jgi:hypothetical protein
MATRTPRTYEAGRDRNGEVVRPGDSVEVFVKGESRGIFTVKEVQSAGALGMLFIIDGVPPLSAHRFAKDCVKVSPLNKEGE